jgi:hypothetical protein
VGSDIYLDLIVDEQKKWKVDFIFAAKIKRNKN